VARIKTAISIFRDAVEASKKGSAAIHMIVRAAKFPPRSSKTAMIASRVRPHCRLARTARTTSPPTEPGNSKLSVKHSIVAGIAKPKRMGARRR
jgi:hypothetical protein